MNRQIKVKLTGKTHAVLEREAAVRGITPAVLARIKLNEFYLSNAEIDLSEKTYLVSLKKWRELEAYIQIKNKTVEQFVIEAIEVRMKQNALTPAQKAEYEKIIGI